MISLGVMLVAPEERQEGVCVAKVCVCVWGVRRLKK